MVFSTDSELSDMCASGKKEKSHGTFGLGYLTPTARCEKEEVDFLYVSKEICVFLFPMEMTEPIKKVRTFFFLKGAWGRIVINVICQLKPSFTYFL